MAAAMASTVQSGIGHATSPGKRGGDRLVVAERQHLFADDLAGFMALAGDQQHVAAAKIRDRTRGSPRARSPISIAPGAACRIAARIAAGSSLRGLSSVTITRSASAPRSRPSSAACRHRGRRRSRTPRPAAASHKAAAPRAPWRARRACAHSRRRSARRCSRRPDSSRPLAPFRLRERGEDGRRLARRSRSQGPAATSAFSTWKRAEKRQAHGVSPCRHARAAASGRSRRCAVRRRRMPSPRSPTVRRRSRRCFAAATTASACS